MQIWTTYDKIYFNFVDFPLQFSKPLQHVSTLMRQLVFDLIFVIENITLLAIALNSNIKELQENQLSFGIVLFGFTIVGLILKAVYYRYLHIWAWLIMDYITKTEDGTFKVQIGMPNANQKMQC